MRYPCVLLTGLYDLSHWGGVRGALSLDGSVALDGAALHGAVLHGAAAQGLGRMHHGKKVDWQTMWGEWSRRR